MKIASQDSFFARHAWGLAASLLAIFEAMRFLFHFFGRQGRMLGWESYQIAQSVASGKGFTFRSEDRWLFERVSDGDFHATAWADPLYTYLLGFIIRLAGGYHMYIAGILNLLCLLVILFLTYQLGKRLMTSAAGFVSVALLIMVGASTYLLQMQPVALSTCLILGSTLALLRLFERPSLFRSGLFGLVLGFTVLGCPSALLFIPVLAIVLFTLAVPRRQVTVLQATTSILIAVITISPWAIRNYVVFDEFVPVRNGAGHLAFVGTVASAAAIDPSTLDTEVEPPWTVVRKRDITARWLNKDRRDLEAFQMDYADEVGGAEYISMNEAKRDKWLMGEAKKFVRAYPWLSLYLSVRKIETFVRTMGPIGIMTFVLAAIGGILATIRLNTVMIVLAGWIAAFVAPFTIIICYFNRYRFPVEPLMILLAVYLLHHIACRIVAASRSFFEHFIDLRLERHKSDSIGTLSSRK